MANTLPDKAQAIQTFWSGFGLPAYDERTVPDDAVMPYITYDFKADSIGDFVTLNASLWYKSPSWEAISKKAEEIAQAIVTMRPPSIQIDTGRLYITKARPFAQRFPAENEEDLIRRVTLTVYAEYLTNY